MKHPKLDNPIDWKFAFNSFNSDNAIEDIEQIRINLVGKKGIIFIAGGSGMAVLGLKYLSKYHKYVQKAFLMSFFKDAEASSKAPLIFLNDFLVKENLKQNYEFILSHNIVSSHQFVFLIQRLFYYDQNEVKELIIKTSSNDLEVFNKWTLKLGKVEDFIQEVKTKWPHIVVFMYETNLPPENENIPDINYPFFQMSLPLHELARQGEIPFKYWNVENLDKISTEVLVVAGSKDQVTPASETERIHHALLNSKFLTFDAYHCLSNEKKCRNELIESFFKHGFNSNKFHETIQKEICKDKLISIH